MALETSNDCGSATIFMRNLSSDSSEEGLKSYIEENFGKTKYCRICRNKETGVSRGTAFARFVNPEDATKCLEEFKESKMQHKFHFHGRNIIVSPVIPRDKVDEAKHNRESEVLKEDCDNATIFMRNLSYDSSEEGLRSYIEENFGKTKYCLICRNKETGDSRGTAFARFVNPEDATKCLEEFKDFEMQHKFHFDGRNIIVLPVIPRDKVDEVKHNREREVLKEERHKRRERLIRERVMAKQRQRRPDSSAKNVSIKSNAIKRKKNRKKNKSKDYKKKIKKSPAH